MTSTLKKVDYVDKWGIKCRVLLPEGHETNFEEGIPISINLRNLYEGVPMIFVRNLTEELFNRGLVEPVDFIKPGMAESIRAALLSTIRKDTLDIIEFARKECQHA